MQIILILVLSLTSHAVVNSQMVAPSRLRYKCISDAMTPTLVIASTVNGKTLATKVFDGLPFSACEQFVREQLVPLMKKAEGGEVEFSADLSILKVHTPQVKSLPTESASIVKEKAN